MGKFVVHDNLPKHLAQGMFAKPGSYGTPPLSYHFLFLLCTLHTPTAPYQASC